MSNGTPLTLQADCVAPAKAGAALAQWCILFTERLAEAYPAYAVRLGDGEAEATPALRVRLLVQHASDTRFEAALAWGSGDDTLTGTPLGTAVMDGTLNRTKVAAFLDNLIAATPAP